MSNIAPPKLIARRIKNMRWGRFLFVCLMEDIVLWPLFLYALFLRLAGEIGFDIEHGISMLVRGCSVLGDIEDELVELVEDASHE